MIADRTSEAVGEAAGQSETAAIALSALHHFLDDPSVDRLRRVLGLTPSGAVRLVDRLQAAGYVTRRPGRDARSVQRVTAARAEVLQTALAGLDEEEQAQLDELISRVLVGQMRGPGATRWMCRLCDMQACGRDEGRCPVASAARERWGSG